MIIDTSVHPVLRDAEMLPLLGQPWSDGRLADPLGLRHPLPGGGLAAPPADAADPASFARELAGRGVDAAVVSPLTRGLEANPQVAAAVARATNAWTAARWLGDGDGVRFFGAIRVPVTSAVAAGEEIAHWVDDERFVALAVPTRTFLPYGDEVYLPIWRAAAQLDMPVLVFDDIAAGVAHPETPVGTVRYFAERYAQAQFAAITHIGSLIASGVFDRLPRLRFVFGDGGVDLARVMLWRLEKDWRSGRVETPWVERLPSAYALGHLRFVARPEDGTSDGEHPDEQLRAITDAERLVLFGSHFPYWDHTGPEDVARGWAGPARERLLAGNALTTMPRLARALGPAALAGTAGPQ